MALADQDRLLLLVYDARLAHRLSKLVLHRDPETIRTIVDQAEQLVAAIPPAQRDFDRAKQVVLETTRL